MKQRIVLFVTLSAVASSCNKAPGPVCSFDRDCGTGYYCNAPTSKCFLLPALDAPTFSSSAPASPSNSLKPVLNGSTEPNATVNLYRDKDCTGPALQTVTSTESGAFAFEVAVSENASDTFYANAVKVDGYPSPCSAGFTYVNDTVPPTIVSTSPAAGVPGASRKGEITVTFSEPMREYSLLHSRLVSSPIGPTSGSMTLQGTVATLLAGGVLSPLTKYQVLVPSSLTDLAGNPLKETTFEFTTSDIEWSAPEPLADDFVGDEKTRGLALAPDGAAFILWIGWDASKYSLWALRRTSQTEGVPTKLSESSSAIRDAKVVTDGEGNAYAAWAEGDAVKAVRYTDGSGWAAEPQTLTEAGNAVASNPSAPVLDLAVSLSGEGAVVWSGSAGRIWARSFTLSGGWASAAEQVSTSTYSGEQPQVAVTGEGSFAVVWSEYDSSTQTPSVLGRQRMGAQWEASVPVLEPGARYPLFRTAANKGMGIWRATSGALRAKTFVAGEGWGQNAVEVSPSSDHNEYSLAFNSLGQALVAWIDAGEVFSSMYLPSTGWSEAERVAPNESESAYPVAAMDSAGNGVVLWGQQDAQSDFESWFLWANRYDVQRGGWGQPQRLTQQERFNRQFDALATFDDTGNAVALFSWGPELEAHAHLSRWNLSAD